MRNHYSHRLLKQGALLMLVGLAAGFMLIFSMLGGISLNPVPGFIALDFPGTPQGWRITHVGSLMNGMMAILLACAMRQVYLPDDSARRVFLGTSIAIWGNFLFYIFGMFAPGHGVTLEDNRLGEASIAGAVAFFSGLVAAITLAYALIVIYRSQPADEDADVSAVFAAQQ